MRAINHSTDGVFMPSPGKTNAAQESRKAEPERQFHRLLRRWAKVWGTATLAEHARIEWSSRFTRTLGRAYPTRMLIRLNAALREPLRAALLEEVLCHEAAHLAVHILHGRDASMHGPEWQRLIQMAGYTPCTGMHVPELVASGDSPIRYEHVCPACQAKRFAKRRQPSWRCFACRRLGRDGKLTIHRRSSTSEARDE